MNNNYVIEPTDVVHGKEWKSHKYISKTMKKGKWVYLYAKNKARGTVTNKNGKIQYSPNVKTQNYNGPIDFNDPNGPWTWGASILTEPLDGRDTSYGYNRFKAVRSKVDQQKIGAAYVNFNKMEDYSRHSQKHDRSKSYSPTVKTETFLDGVRRYIEPKDWRTIGSSRKKSGKAMNRTKNGINN